MTADPPFGARLAAARILCGYRSQTALAQALNMSQSTISRWESNESVPNRLEAIALDQVLGTGTDLTEAAGHEPMEVDAPSGPLHVPYEGEPLTDEEERAVRAVIDVLRSQRDE